MTTSNSSNEVNFISKTLNFSFIYSSVRFLAHKVAPNLITVGAPLDLIIPAIDNVVEILLGKFLNNGLLFGREFAQFAFEHIDEFLSVVLGLHVHKSGVFQDSAVLRNGFQVVAPGLDVVVEVLTGKGCVI